MSALKTYFLDSNCSSLYVRNLKVISISGYKSKLPMGPYQKIIIIIIERDCQFPQLMFMWPVSHSEVVKFEQIYSKRRVSRPSTFGPVLATN